MMVKDSNYSANDGINDDQLVGRGKDSMGPLENNSVGNHSRRILGVVNPNDSFTYMVMTLRKKMSFTYGPSMPIGNFFQM